MLKMNDTGSVTLNDKGLVYLFHLNLREADECRQSKIQNKLQEIKQVDRKNEIMSKLMAE